MFEHRQTLQLVVVDLSACQVVVQQLLRRLGFEPCKQWQRLFRINSHLRRNRCARDITEMLRTAAKKLKKQGHFLNWSRQEELNTPSADYKSAALTLSYTGANRAY
jgi:hypothetical protein